MKSPLSADEILAEVDKLPLDEQLRLLTRLIEQLEQRVHRVPVTAPRSLWGCCADLGDAPSAQEIDETRHQLWAGFERANVE